MGFILNNFKNTFRAKYSKNVKYWAKFLSLRLRTYTPDYITEKGGRENNHICNILSFRSKLHSRIVLVSIFLRGRSVEGVLMLLKAMTRAESCWEVIKH